MSKSEGQEVFETMLSMSADELARAGLSPNRTIAQAAQLIEHGMDARISGHDDYARVLFAQAEAILVLAMVK